MVKRQLTIPCLGYGIAADWYEGDSQDKILFILTGYGSSKARYADFVGQIVPKVGASAVVIDYSGHGASPLKLAATRPAQHFLEVVTVFDLLRAQYPDADIDVIGTSYGSFLAAYLAKCRSFHALILRTPAIYRPRDFYATQADIDREVATQVYRKDAKAVSAHPLFALPNTLTGPTLVIVHGKDEDVPAQTTNAYVKAFNAQAYIAKGFKHFLADPTNPPGEFARYYKTIVDWLKT